MIDASVFAAAAEATKRPPSDQELADIAELAREQQDLEQRIVAAETALDLLKEALVKVAEHKLPDAMAAVGMTEFTLGNGYKVKVDTEYYANIPSPDTGKPELLERRMAAFQWLRDNRHDDLIKAQIVVEAGRGEQEKARRVMAGLDKAGIGYTNTEAVHWSTLKAFVREQMTLERGPEAALFPEQLFGVCVKQVAKVKAPKKK